MTTSEMCSYCGNPLVGSQEDVRATMDPDMKKQPCEEASDKMAPGQPPIKALGERAPQRPAELSVEKPEQPKVVVLDKHEAEVAL
ncbi:hypothetical protein V5O48_011080 [Marasmius crinis-equi]|uniref:Uncharacterized protein n=1 Tax=Marasmius crinis-equi TaxID=585013 RepID=A0ABR3F6L7_9AGAR